MYWPHSGHENPLGTIGSNIIIINKFRKQFIGRRERPPPQDKIQNLDFTKDPSPLYYKTPPCAFYRKNARSKAVIGP